MTKPLYKLVDLRVVRDFGYLNPVYKLVDSDAFPQNSIAGRLPHYYST